ncbi:MAG: amidase [Aquisalimonadaceae bacterium]
MRDTQIADMTAMDMLRAYRRGDLSPVDTAKACLQRIERYNPVVNAYCLVDEEVTLAAARESEARWRRGEPKGLVDGVPTAIKDVFMTRGWFNRKASHTIPDTPVEEDAPAIAALRRNGFVPMGKVTTPEFGWKGITDSPLCGITRNPWDPDKTPGGSSGGSSAAIALGMAALALGTDAGGSIRIPAGFTGVVGHKPTQGRCPIWPQSPFGALAHPGPMTWTVEDTALLLNVMAESAPQDTTLPSTSEDFLVGLNKGVRGLRIAFSPRFGYVDVHPEIAASVKQAATAFQELGAIVEEVDPDIRDPLEAFNILFYGGAANAMRDLGPKQRERMDPGLVEVSAWAEKLSMLDYLGAQNERAALIEHMNMFHERYDLLLSPSLPIPAFKAGVEVPEGWHHPRWPTWTPFTYPFNMTGQPACSVPCGFTSAGLPIGLQLVGGRHQDALVLRAAHAYQMARPLTDKRPDPR